MRRIILHILIFLIGLDTLAQTNNDSLMYRNFLMPSPSVTYSPETDFVFGVYGLYQFKFKDYQDVSKASILQVYASQSLKKQTTVRFDHKV